MARPIILGLSAMGCSVFSLGIQAYALRTLRTLDANTTTTASTTTTSATSAGPDLRTLATKVAATGIAIDALGLLAPILCVALTRVRSRNRNRDRNRGSRSDSRSEFASESESDSEFRTGSGSGSGSVLLPLAATLAGATAASVVLHANLVATPGWPAALVDKDGDPTAAPGAAAAATPARTAASVETVMLATTALETATAVCWALVLTMEILNVCAIKRRARQADSEVELGQR